MINFYYHLSQSRLVFIFKWILEYAKNAVLFSRSNYQFEVDIIELCQENEIICKRHINKKNPRIKSITTGSSFQIEQILKQSKATWVIIHNNDFVLFKSTILNLLNTASSFVHSSELGLVYSEVHAFNEQNKFTIAKNSHIEFYQGNIHSTIYGGVSLNVSSGAILIPKDRFFEAGGLNFKLDLNEQLLDLALRLQIKGYKTIESKGHVLKKSPLKSEIFSPKFQKIWFRRIFEQFWSSKINGDKEFIKSEHRFRVTFIVTETGDDATAGDFFTAKELGAELEKFDWEVNFLGKSDDWYNIDQNTDILIVMLHDYHISRLKCTNEKLVKIAWIRNWFDLFVTVEGFINYDLVLSSSKTAIPFIKNLTNASILFYPLATNFHKYKFGTTADISYECDYCFTGSYWNDPREIINSIDPLQLPDKVFHIYGANWDRVQNLKNYHKGFVKYKNLFKIYDNTKILIDDANRVTKPWGSVNSRVFDALISGVLVITNGKVGVDELFDGKVPTYNSRSSLYRQLNFYFKHDHHRVELVKKLKKEIINNHTYHHRAEFLKNKLETFFTRAIVINLPVPDFKNSHQWGDYHLAKGLKEEFESSGYRVKLEFLNDWDKFNSSYLSNCLTLRGLSRYRPRPSQRNLMWNISHPNDISSEEYESYDHIFVASEKWAKHLKSILKTDVSCLLQCTDPNIFHPPEEQEKISHKILFVGNSRGVFRKGVKILIENGFEVSIYGSGWEGLVEDRFIRGIHIKNSELYRYYGGAEMLINDHWADMREKGFISNRVFDALACNSILITDNVDGVQELFDEIIVYNNAEDLVKIIKSYPKLSSKIKHKSREVIVKRHTYKERVRQIIENL